MRTDSARWIAGAALAALAMACSRPGPGADIGAGAPAPSGAAAAAACALPESLAAAHRGGWCDLPRDLRGFVAGHEEFRTFSGGEPSNAEGLQELARVHDRRVLEQAAQWAQLRQRHGRAPAVAAWMDRYGQEYGLP